VEVTTWDGMGPYGIGAKKGHVVFECLPLEAGEAYQLEYDYYDGRIPLTNVRTKETAHIQTFQVIFGNGVT
jgi:hypothetical protein